jgi:DNA processing protein
MWAVGRIPGQPGVAIVGTRRCTSYGRRVAHWLGEAVARAGWPVVSGLARGIDAAAHQAVVRAGGVGVAVLGCGIDIIYPPENGQLASDLVSCGGALLSEYSPGTPPAPFRFPARNRLIAGLSSAVVVVEAGLTGGALITARLALEQGKEVLAVPGDIDRPTSAGCNLLIRDGAHPVLGAEDLINSLEFILGPAPAPRAIEEITSGGTIDEWVAASDRPVSEALAELARRELEGALRLESGRLLDPPRKGS